MVIMPFAQCYKMKLLFVTSIFQIAICAPYWMVNNTGIPLIFKQDGVPYDNAGQFDEHEMARSLTPLLFSFADRDAPYR